MTTHVDLATLAALAEGTLPVAEAEASRAHLGRCHTCMAAYADAVSVRAATLADPDRFVATPEELRWALSNVSKVMPETLPAGPSASHVRGVARWARGWRLAAAMVPASAATALIVWVAVLRPTSSSLEFDLSPAVREATERSSARGLVLPGAAVALDRSPHELRSGQIQSSPDLDREVRAAIAEYERVPSSDAGARVVASLLAAGEIDAARDYAKECLSRSPDHVPLLIFAADACYRSNDLAGAEELLRRAARQASRDDLIALDLALVVQHLDRKDEARVLLTRVAKGRSPLAARAARELSKAD